MNKLSKLKTNLMNLLPNSGYYHSNIAGFHYSRRNKPTDVQRCFYNPMAIVVLQGEKQTIIGSEDFTYHAGECVIASIDIPTAGKITKATPESPFLTLILDLDNSIIAELISEIPVQKEEAAKRGTGIMKAEDDLLDAFSRLLELEKNTAKQKIMAPLVIKEIHYILLSSQLGNLIRAVNTKGSQNSQIAGAINWLKENFRQPLKIDELAQKFNMAESSFYRNFNKVTSLSPLQYQKKLRLHEAQHLMLSKNLSAENACYQVGYESASQFNREYKRMFGTPPKTNINKLKTA